MLSPFSKFKNKEKNTYRHTYIQTDIRSYTSRLSRLIKIIITSLNKYNLDTREYYECHETKIGLDFGASEAI